MLDGRWVPGGRRAVVARIRTGGEGRVAGTAETYVPIHATRDRWSMGQWPGGRVDGAREDLLVELGGTSTYERQQSINQMPGARKVRVRRINLHFFQGTNEGRQVGLALFRVGSR